MSGPERRRAWLAAAASPRTALALALPLAVSTAFAVLSGRGAAAPFELRSVWLWGVALAASVTAAAVAAAREGRWHRMLGAAGILAILLQGPAWWAWRFEGTCDAGEGEATPRWRRVAAGPWATPPALGVIEIAPAGRVRLAVDGEIAAVDVGQGVRLGGASVRPVAIYPAPAFEVTRAGGEVVESGLLKLAPDDEGSLQVGYLPHRFTLAAVEGRKAEGFAAPEVLRLRVERGKLVVVDRVVERDAPVAFEGLAFRWGEGARWARVEVRRTPAPVLAGLGLVLLLEAAVAAALARRRR